MHREVYDVPDSLKPWVHDHCNKGTLLDTLIPTKKISSQIVHIDYLQKENKLLLIGDKRVLITMKDIIYCRFKRQETLEKQTKRIEEAEQKREKTRRRIKSIETYI